MLSNSTKSRIGINRVSTVVENLWSCGWQEYAAQNDDAFDGVIIMRRGAAAPAATGGMVYVQVKCGSDGYKKEQKQYPDHIGVALGPEYISKHFPRWCAAPGPAVLVFVDDSVSKERPKAYWVDVRQADAYSPTNKGMVLVPRENRFSHHTKGTFHKLCGSLPADVTFQELSLTRSDSLIPNLGKKGNLRKEAERFYKDWRDASEWDVNPALGPILVNRVGWEHICRAERLPERVSQSWLLLGAARKMISECTAYWTLGNASSRTLQDGSVEVTDYLALRARVFFPHRHHSVVQVVLKRSRLACPVRRNEREKIWFYSVYELRRGAK